jgi:hypothetical protein
LAAAFPQDARPMVALALLLQKSGDTPAALTALTNAKQRSGKTGTADPVLDKLAASWSMLATRSQEKGGTPKPGAGGGVSPTVQPAQGESVPAPVPLTP